MLPDPPQQRLQREVATARTVWHETRRKLDSRRREPAQVGDIFSLNASLASSGAESELDGRWAAVDDDGVGRLRLVPVSTNPLVGPTDVKSTPSSPAGALVMHCDFALWFRAEDLDATDRDGILADEDVERARAKLVEIIAGGSDGTRRQQEVRRDPLYEKLAAELGDSRRRLVESLHRTRFPRFRPVRRLNSFWRSASVRIAATVLLALGVGFLAGMAWDSKVGPEAAAPILGLPLAWLPPGEGLRGEGTTLLLNAEASHAVLILSLETVPSHARYRIEVDRQAGEGVWSAELLPGESVEISVVLPRRILLPDRVGAMLEIKLFGVGEEGEETVGFYRLRVEPAPRSSASRR